MRHARTIILLLLLLLLLAGSGAIAWRVAGLPPVGFVLRHGLSWGCEPTGETMTIEGVEFVEIGPGCFRMGSTHLAEGGDLLGKLCAAVGLPWGDQPKPSEEMPVHWVEFRRGFWIARTEATNEQYWKFDPDWTDAPLEPAAGMSWLSAKRYCSWLAKKSGLPVRLPTEAEWECACRAGSGDEYEFGDDESELPEHAWFEGNSLNRPHKVRGRRPNAWKLFDVHGNISEWCVDVVSFSYADAPADGSAREEITEERMRLMGSVPMMIHRGGSILTSAAACRAAARDWRSANVGSLATGLRPVFSSVED